jgi:hypothetical protein
MQRICIYPHVRCSNCARLWNDFWWCASWHQSSGSPVHSLPVHWWRNSSNERFFLLQTPRSHFPHLLFEFPSLNKKHGCILTYKITLGQRQCRQQAKQQQAHCDQCQHALKMRLLHRERSTQKQLIPRQTLMTRRAIKYSQKPPKLNIPGIQIVKWSANLILCWSVHEVNNLNLCVKKCQIWVGCNQCCRNSCLLSPLWARIKRIQLQRAGIHGPFLARFFRATFPKHDVFESNPNHWQ